MHPEENKTSAVIVAEGERLPAAPPAPKETYWGRVAARYSLMTRVLAVILLLFTVIFLLVFSRVFTYDSLFSFVKDMQTVPSFVRSNYATVYAMYEGGDTSALLYRESIVFVGQGGVEIYAPDGSRLLDVSRELKHPRAVASDKYLLAFDHGGFAFSVTNPYGELHRGESDFPILGATVSQDGSFALITTSSEAISRVLLYDNNFNPIRSITRHSATVGIAFTDDGGIAILSAGADNGRIFTVLDHYDQQMTEIEHSVSFDNEMPLAISRADDSLMLLTNRTLRVCDTKGRVETAISFDGVPVDFTVTDEGALLVTRTDAVTAANRVICVDDGGDVAFDGSFTGDVLAATFADDAVSLLCPQEITRISMKSGEMQTVSAEVGANDVLAVDPTGLRVIYDAKAEYVSFENS